MFETLFQANFEICSVWGTEVALWLSVGVGVDVDVGIVYIIMRQLREQATGGKREKENANGESVPSG